MERAIARLGEAEQLDPEVPSALYEERARYHAALGLAELAAADRRRAAARRTHDLPRPDARGHDALRRGRSRRRPRQP